MKRRRVKKNTEGIMMTKKFKKPILQDYLYGMQVIHTPFLNEVD